MTVDTHRQKGMFALTGSQAFSMMKGVSETLAGRMAIVELQGLSLREKFDISYKRPFIPTDTYITERKPSSYDNLWYHIHRGSMPELADTAINWSRYYSSYVQTYIEKDIRQLVNLSDELTFLKFLTALASRVGELLNYHAIAQDIEVSIDTVKRWISLLKTSGIIYLLEPYTNNLLKRMIKTPKIYFHDTGLVAYLTRWTNYESLRTGAQAGHIFENFIMSEIVKTYLHAGISAPPIYFYRDKDKREIDLIIEDNGCLYPVEIKMTGNPTKHMGKNFKILDRLSGQKVGLGVILCQIDTPVYLQEDLIALPVEYV